MNILQLALYIISNIGVAVEEATQTVNTPVGYLGIGGLLAIAGTFAYNKFQINQNKKDIDKQCSKIDRLIDKVDKVSDDIAFIRGKLEK